MTAGMAAFMPRYAVRMSDRLQRFDDDAMLLWPHCNRTGTLCSFNFAKSCSEVQCTSNPMAAVIVKIVLLQMLCHKLHANCFLLSLLQCTHRPRP